jgi:hypothetical protein
MKSKTTITDVTIEVKKKHFDLAFAAQAKYKDLTTTCLLAQAIKEVFPKKSVEVSNNYCRVGKTYFGLPAKAQKLIERFDSLTYNDQTKAEKNRATKLRDSLPVSFKLITRVEEALAAAA